MKEYEVTLHYNTYLCVKVDAENEKDALEKARSKAECCTNAIIDCLQEEGNDVECLEPEVIEADTAGYMVKFPDADEVFYVASSCPPIGDGVCYKSKEAFDDQQGICYIPEHDFKDISAWRDLDCDSELQERLANYLGTHGMDSGHVALDVGYTWEDLRERVYSWIGDTLNDVCDDKYFELFVDYIQERLFNELDWQGPDALLYAWDVMELYDDAPQLCYDDPRLTDKQKEELYG